MIAAIPIRCAHRAGAACAAALFHAIVALQRVDMRDASCNIELARSKSADWAGGEARLICAAFARTGASIRFGKINVLAKRQCAAPSVPQAPVGMDQHAKRRWIHRFGLLRPTLKRRPGRTVKGEYRLGAQSRRDRTQYASRPAIERVRLAVGGFRRSLERRPMFPPDKADQNERADLIVRRKISWAGMEAAAIGKSMGRYRFFDVREFHMLRLYCPPTSNSASLIWPSEQTRTASIRTEKTFSFRITA